MVEESIPLGPSLTGTLVAKDLEGTVRAYCDHLSTRVYEESAVSEVQASLWGKPRLVGAPIVTLCSPSGYPWMRVIRNPDVVPARPFLELGWMALEVLVQDVDSLADRLQGSPFTLVEPPDRREGMENVRVLRVIGPAGEVLCLTQVDAGAAPYDFPRARCDVDRLLIPVSSCLRREAALNVYAGLGATRNRNADTTMSAVNAAHGLDPDLRHAVATVQLAGQGAVEIYQLGVATARPPSAGGFPAGIAIVSFLIDDIDAIGLLPVSPAARPGGKLYAGQPVVACRGSAGELIELIQAAM